MPISLLDCCKKNKKLNFNASRLWLNVSEFTCRNPNLRLITKAKACKGAGQDGSSGVTSHAPGSAGECEDMNPHTPK